MATQAPTLPEKVIRFIEASSALAEKAAAGEQAQAEREKQAGALIPGIVDALLAIRVDTPHGQVPLLEADEKQAAAEALADPGRALHILSRVAGHFKQAQADRIGQGDPKGREKSAHAGDPGPYAGRRSAEEPPSWRNFKAAVMGS